MKRLEPYDYRTAPRFPATIGHYCTLICIVLFSLYVVVKATIT